MSFGNLLARAFISVHVCEDVALFLSGALAVLFLVQNKTLQLSIISRYIDQSSALYGPQSRDSRCDTSCSILTQPNSCDFLSGVSYIWLPTVASLLGATVFAWVPKVTGSFAKGATLLGQFIYQDRHWVPSQDQCFLRMSKRYTLGALLGPLFPTHVPGHGHLQKLRPSLALILHGGR